MRSLFSRCTQCVCVCCAAIISENKHTGHAPFADAYPKSHSVLNLTASVGRFRGRRVMVTSVANRLMLRPSFPTLKGSILRRAVKALSLYSCVFNDGGGDGWGARKVLKALLLFWPN